MIHAKETVYNGYRFRSRLEARWAVFFDNLGVKYQYEPQDYVLADGTRYLPDFYLPDYPYWVEIKGQHPTEQECHKAGLLSAHDTVMQHYWSGGGVILIAGDPWPGEYVIQTFWSLRFDLWFRKYIEEAVERFDVGVLQLWEYNMPFYYWPEATELLAKAGKGPVVPIYSKSNTTRLYDTKVTELQVCVICGMLTTLYPLPAPSGEDIRGHCQVHGANHGTIDHPRLLAAYTAARQARFEFGENGAPRR